MNWHALPAVGRWQKRLDRQTLFASIPQRTSSGILCYSSRSQRSETAWDLTLKQSWDKTFLHVWSLNWTQISWLRTRVSQRARDIWHGRSAGTEDEWQCANAFWHWSIAWGLEQWNFPHHAVRSTDEGLTGHHVSSPSWQCSHEYMIIC